MQSSKYRQALAHLRTNAHNLAPEKGRWEHNERYNRYCLISFPKNIGFIKDEYYFMSDCCFFYKPVKKISSHFCTRYGRHIVNNTFFFHSNSNLQSFIKDRYPAMITKVSPIHINVDNTLPSYFILVPPPRLSHPDGRYSISFRLS